MADNQLKEPPVQSAVMQLPQPPPRNAEEYLKAYTGYAYTAVSAIAQEVASIDLHLYKAKFVKGVPESTEVYEHEVLSFLDYVNPLTTFYDLVEATQIYLELVGEAYWVVLKQGQSPREIWMVRPDWIKVIPGRDSIVDHYSYHPGGGLNKVDIPRENMIPFKYFNPLNPYRGKGSIQAAALPFDIHNFAQEYNRNFFFNSAIPSMVFTTEQKLSEATVKRFVNQWQASYGGRSKSNKVAFLGNGLKVDKISVGGRELDFNEQQRMLRDDILAVFKVPKTVLGLTDDVNRSNAKATTIAFMERVVTPRMRKFVGVLNEFLLPMYSDDSLFFDFTDPAPEDAEMKLKRYENALKWGWMTPNEVRAEENMEPIEGGDTLPVPNRTGIPATIQPTEPPSGEEQEGLLSSIGKVLTGKNKEPATVGPSSERKRLRLVSARLVKHMVRLPVKRLEVLEREKLSKKLAPEIVKVIGKLLERKDANGTGFKVAPSKSKVVWDDAKKDAYWRQFIESADGWEMRLRNIAVEAFGEQEHLLLDILNNTVKYWRKDYRIGKAGSAIPGIDIMDKIWLTVWVEAIRELFLEQGSKVLDFLGVGGNIDLATETASRYFRHDVAELVKGIDETTRQQLKETLEEGFKKGEGIDKLQKRVKDVFQEAKTSRARMIARTEAIRASNTASVEAYRQSGVVEAKEWLAERDSRTCPFCMEMDGKVIGLNEAYFKEGDIMKVGGQKLDIAIGVPEPPLHSNCYSKDTEAYTREGWKLIKDIKKGESVWTLNPGTLQLEESKVRETTSFKADSVYHLTNKQHSFDLMVSKNHPFVGFKRIDHGQKGRKLEFVRYESLKDVPKEEFRFYVSSEWIGEVKGKIKIGNKLFRTEDWCKFLGYYLSEGSVTKRKNKDHYQISISQSKYLDEMYEDISVMPFDKVCLGKDKIYIFDREVALYLVQFGKSSQKYIPDEIKELDIKYLRVFLDAFRLGDGSIRKGNRYKGGNFVESNIYSTSSPKLAGDLGELIVKIGKAVSFNIRHCKGQEVKFKNGTYKLNNDQIAIYELTSQFRMFRNIDVKEVVYNDYVYDFEVEKNHILLIRRNGKVVWGSNCRCTTIPVLLGER